jgi:hypothetical protein
MPLRHSISFVGDSMGTRGGYCNHFQSQLAGAAWDWVCDLSTLPPPLEVRLF